MSITECIAPGKILYLSVCFPHETKPECRYFVVAATVPNLLLLKINTSGNLSEIAKRKNESQFKIKPTVYPFLRYESYLDCGTVWYTLITSTEAAAQLKSSPDWCVGEITNDHKNEIIRRIDLSKSISPKHKRLVAEALKP